MVDIGLAGWGTALPKRVRTYEEIAALSDIPADVIRNKFGLNQVYVAGPDEQPSELSAEAARSALAVARMDAADLALIIYHGSEYKDFIVWSIATKIQGLLGADNAYAFEIYSLCAGAGVAINAARGMMQADPNLRNVLLVAASRELDQVDYNNQRGRFMFNFGSGAGPLLLRRDFPTNRIVGTAVITDPSLSETVVVPAGGTRQPVSAQTVETGQHTLDVTDLEFMRERLGAVSMPNFIEVIKRAVEQGGHTVDEIDYLGITHMKASFHRAILNELGLEPRQSVYLKDYGHVQSADQAIAIDEGVRQKRIAPGDLVVLAGAGTGYTWSAAAIEWGPRS
ncbi:MAG: 3-oxoacyl-ACP synthase [Anaerolineae bacterium]